jgi:hypothetical protein
MVLEMTTMAGDGASPFQVSDDPDDNHDKGSEAAPARILLVARQDFDQFLCNGKGGEPPSAITPIRSPQKKR